MPSPYTNRPMFRRLVRRLLFANRGRLFVILLALSAGAAVSAALLNLQTDAKRRLNFEFRSFGANVFVSSRDAQTTTDNPSTFSEKYAEAVIKKISIPGLVRAPFLYFIANVEKGSDASIPDIHKQVRAVSVGTDLETPFDMLIPGMKWPTPSFLDADEPLYFNQSQCIVGEKLARQLEIRENEFIEISYETKSLKLKVFRIVSTGSEIDSQIFIGLENAQRSTGKQDQISLIQISFPGTPREISRFHSDLASFLPDLEVRPLRQFSEAQAKIYSRISGLLTAATVLILTLTTLCVMAAVTNIAAERRNDVGMMKAIGGSARRVLNLFLTEAALVGLAGGLIGSAVG